MTRAWLLRRLVGDGRRHGLALLALALAFGVVAFAAAGARLVGRAAAPPAAPSARVIAYLDEGVDAARAAELERVLASLPGVEAVRAVSAREGLDELRGALGARATVLEGVGPDLLAPSLEVVARPAAASALAIRLGRLRGVADVDLVSAAPAPRAPDARRPARLGVALAGALGLLAVVAALAVLRARLRVELSLWLAVGLTRAASVRPALWLAMAAGVAGVALGGVGASWAAGAWLGVGALPAREVALGAAGLVVLAFFASRVALRIPEAAGAA